MTDPTLCLSTGPILLPREDISLTSWACVACDQFTSQPEYWREADALVGGAPSTLRMILPECYLAEAQARIPQIHATMRDYLAQGVLQASVPDGFVLTERNTGSGARVGLVAMLDLESYDYRAGFKSPVRATEGTIVERIPPRMQVRRGAPLECSHILLLLDDPQQTVIEPLFDRREELRPLYDFPLMMNGGQLTGYAVEKPADVAQVFHALSSLKAAQRSADGMLYAVGDGNHSLATAKACWEELKRTLPVSQQADHPSRYAMVEIENLHDDALQFEPIHRVLFGYDGDDLLDELERYALAHDLTLHAGDDGQPILCVYEGKEAPLSLGGQTDALPVGTLQRMLDAWLAEHPGCRLDYVHGEAAVRALAEGERTVGFLLPAMDKLSLFPYVEANGALPRKTFSMGEAHEKRYYMEARRIL